MEKYPKEMRMVENITPVLNRTRLEFMIYLKELLDNDLRDAIMMNDRLVFAIIFLA